MAHKISVITVVFNDAAHIRQTMESFFAQTWEEKEYIVIDGGSTDGTAEVVREYADRLAFWCSEPDGGIYDAMNKGLAHATGEWVNILNSGDSYCSPRSLERAITECTEKDTADVIFGNSVAVSQGEEMHVEAEADTSLLSYRATYRHGSSLVRTATHRRYPFATERKAEFGFALDFDVIYRMHHDGCRFAKVAVDIERYEVEGVSQNAAKSLLYNYRITTQYGASLRKWSYFQKHRLKTKVAQSKAFRYLRDFIFEYFLNDILPHCPLWKTRRFAMRRLGLKIGRDTFVSKDTYFMTPRCLTIGTGCCINRQCLLDARGHLTIGNNVCLSHRVNLVTGSHEVNTPDFQGRYRPIVVDDYVWIGIGATVLQGVHIGRGAVVCAGAVVTHDVEPFTIVAGTPARPIGQRTSELDYRCEWNILFT